MRLGIDFSISCPAIVLINDESKIINSYFLSATKKKHFYGQYDLSITKQKNLNDIERFHLNSEMLLNKIKEFNPTKIYLEGYSFGSKGSLVFTISEATALLKYKLYLNDLPFEIIPPKQVKSLATGNGNASKDLMYEYFVKQTGIKLKEIFQQKDVKSPVSDIVDAYFIAKGF